MVSMEIQVNYLDQFSKYGGTFSHCCIDGLRIFLIGDGALISGQHLALGPFQIFLGYKE